MRPMHLAWCAVLTLFASQPLRAQTVQTSQTYLQLEQEVATLHQAGKIADAIPILKRCHELAPRDARSAYNLACCYALSGDVATGLQWLESAAEFGFGIDSAELELARSGDKDLAALRADPRFEAALRTMEARKAAAEAYSKDAIVYVPEALKDAESVGLLVVLHDAGETKDLAFSNGPWKRLADELDLALVIPSARFPVGKKPEEGMRWFRWAFEYAQEASSPTALERTISDALSAFRKQRKVLADRTYLAGHGQGGLVAFHRAVRSPDEFRRVIVDSSAILPPLAETVAPGAAKLGLQVRFLMADRNVWGLPDEPAAIDKAAKSYAEALKRWKLQGTVERYVRDPSNADADVTRLKSALASFDAPPAPEGSK
jgi:predicted esterase